MEALTTFKTSGTGLDSADDCQWACDRAGFDNSQNRNLCETTQVGYYSPAGSSPRIACSDTAKPDDSSWDISTTGLASFRECWSCDASYYPSRNRNACVKVNIAIAAGEKHTCAILDDDGDASNGGPVKCWGANRYGQIGGGTSSSFQTASGKAGDPLSGQTATHIAAGEEHTCAILTDKTVKCWGANTSGQTGGGTSGSYRTISGTAGDPLSRQTATHIAAGEEHTCAILTDKTVKCWGANRYGQTGGGTSGSYRTISGTAGDPLSGQTATHIATGGSHTCVILTDKMVKCWGRNGSGETGGGTSIPYRTISGTAGDPLSGQTATHIATGGSHTCAILIDKTVKCWGKNGSGRTGGGISSPSQTASGTAGDPLSGQTVTHIAAGEEHTCAILIDKTVKCWGSNDDGETGGGTPLSQGEEATYIAAGGTHTCAILDDDGDLKCWGGYTGIANISLTKNQEDQTATHIAAGGTHTCAILDDDGDASNGGPVKCWGRNDEGQIGGGISGSSRTISGKAGDPLSGQTATHITVGGSHTCAILTDKTVKCWGSNGSGRTGGGTLGSSRTISGTAGDPLSGQTATHIAAGKEHTCSILTDKTVKCWGRNGFGQTGGGTLGSYITISGTAGDPLSGQTATHIAVGESHTCAILMDKTVKCWGSNSSGQTGGGTPLSRGEEATYIAAGGTHTCAILTDKTVKCWGANSSGQTGGGTSSTSQTASGTAGDPLSGQTATHIAAGSRHACAILIDKTVKCWGSNSSGQTGGGTPLSQGEEATHIAAGYFHTCAILMDKTVKCWGQQYFYRHYYKDTDVDFIFVKP